MTKVRLEAFTDGVLAVAITLLVLDLRACVECWLRRVGLWLRVPGSRGLACG